MHRIGLALLGLVLAALWHVPARASGDFSCSPKWKLSHVVMSGCDDMALLAPAADTRSNLALLLLDKRGQGLTHASGTPFFDWATLRLALAPPSPAAGNGDYADGEGSRCRSNDAGVASFAQALAGARGVPEGERGSLLAARKAMQPTCTGAGSAPATIGPLKSAGGRAYGDYLQGAQAFYDGDFDAADRHFAALGDTDQAWLKETALYMLGRVAVNRAQVDAFDAYGNRTDRPIDRRLIDAGEAGLTAYLKAYPQGRYAVSARGLLRRVYWLGGRTDMLAATYAALFAQDPATRGITDVDLAEEVDNKLLAAVQPAGAIGDPILLAVLDLQAMRGTEGSEERGKPPLALADLLAQRPHFAKDPTLFDYLLAAHAWFVENKPAEVLRLIPDAARQKSFSYLQFSRQMLRGIALDAVGDRNARGFWLDMLGGAVSAYQRSAVELAIAHHDERAHALDLLFAANSPVSTPAIRGILLANVAPAALLRREAKDMAVPAPERTLALFTLLYKEVTRGAYGDFLSDMALVPSGAPAVAQDVYDPVGIGAISPAIFASADTGGDYDCPALKAIAAALSADAHAPRARLCLADFMFANGFDGFALDSQPPGGELGGTPSLFPGKPFSRLEIYKALIADARTPAADKAYALYRAINCYAPTGSNACGGTTVPKATRKAWFAQLKKDYPASHWAQSLRYYW